MRNLTLDPVEPDTYDLLNLMLNNEPSLVQGVLDRIQQNSESNTWRIPALDLSSLLEHIGEWAPSETINLLCRLSTHKNKINALVVLALGLTKPKRMGRVAEVQSALQAAADHGEPEVKENAAKSLSILIELGDEFVIGVLMQLASTATWRDVGRKAVKALGDVAEKTDKAIDALQNLSREAGIP